MWCHLLLMSPVIGLGLFLILPWSIALSLYLVVVALSLWLYLKIMESMRRPVVTGSESLLGRVGEIRSDGSLTVKGERWLIAGRDDLVPGRRVRIVGFEGLRLKVQPVGEEIYRPPSTPFRVLKDARDRR